MHRSLAFTGFILLPICLQAAEPVIEQVDLFHAGEDGYALYRIPGVVVTDEGTVLVYCEARKRAKGDWGTIDILMRRSTDGGRTFDEPRPIAVTPDDVTLNPVSVAQGLAKDGEITQNNPVMIVDHIGAGLHLVYCIEYARVFYRNSMDDGLTWSPPREITSIFETLRPQYDWKVVATGPGHGIQLRTTRPGGPREGRLVIACWLSDGSGGHAHRPSIVCTIYSDDAGETWECGEVVVAHPDLINPSETVPVQLSDGRVMLNIRSENEEHRRALSYSNDGATGWTQPVFHEQLLESVCMGSTVRLSGGPNAALLANPLPKDRNRILFVNPHSQKPRDSGSTSPNRSRENVSVKLSYDDGRTWPVGKVIEPGRSGYSDLAVSPDGTIFCFYERGVKGDDYQTARLALARLNLEWLTDGRDSLE